jgi:hypothetical protein
LRLRVQGLGVRGYLKFLVYVSGFNGRVQGQELRIAI